MKKSFLTLALLLLPAIAIAQWKELPGPSAGAVNDICAIAGTNGAEMYAATPDGVYRTVDSGKTWKLVGLKGQNVQKLTQYVVGGTEILLAIVNQEGSLIWNLCRSEDSAQTWDTIYRKEHSGNGPKGILDVLQDGNDIVICVPSKDVAEDTAGIYRSTDIGDHWFYQAPIPRLNVLDFTIGNGSLFAIDDDTLWTMTSHGVQWVPTSYPYWHKPQSVKFFGGELFVGAAGRLDISTDNGVTWLNPPNVGLDTNYFGDTTNYGDLISMFAVNGLTIIAAGPTGAYRSTNGASTWQHIQGTGYFPRAYYSSIIEYLNGRFFDATGQGLVTSADGISWMYQTEGITGGTDDIVSAGKTLFSITPRGIFRSNDHGQTWLDPSGPHDLVDSDAIKLYTVGNRTFAGGYGVGLWKWNDSEWDNILNRSVLSLSGDSTSLFAALGSSGILRSQDNGATWVTTNNGLPIDSGGVETVLAENGLVLAFTAEGSVYASENDGDSWNWRSVKQLLGYPDYAVFVSSKIYAARRDGYLFLSTDNGASWEDITLPDLSDNNIFGLWDLGSNLIFSRFNGIYAEDGNMTLIFPDSDLIPNNWMQGFAQDDSFVFVSRYFGNIYAEPISNLPLAVSSESNRSETIALRIFPNPTSSSGTFSFTLPRREHVSLQLFDELGVNHGTYFDGVTGPGETEVPFNAARLAAGTYIAVLSKPEGSAMARIMVLPK